MRARWPAVAIVEMSDDMEAFKSMVRELLAVSPETAIAGAYRPNTFAPQKWEQAAQGAIFVEGLRVGVRDFLRRPVSTADLRQLLDRSVTPPSRAAKTSGVTISFISNKGGVGKSTLAVNVATRLAQHHPGEVLLIDASLQMGVCATMLELKPTTTLLDTIRERHRLDSTLIRQLATPHACGLDLLAAPPDALSATEIDDELLTRVLNLARRTYEYVIVDTFPMFDRIVMSVTDAADLSYIVLDNVVPTVLSIVQLMSLLDDVGYPTERRRVAVNRFLRVPGNPSLDDIRHTLQHSVDHVLPFDKRAITAANLGRPFALSRSRWSGVEKGLKGIVREIEERQGQGSHAESNGRSNGIVDTQAEAEFSDE
ncbi:Chromosome partitioning protein ParA [Thalassoglobus neptunius]|uniref:Chromosome partitioning protein ParA n=1 Tax=Thalassoglobus neptunius TaxID=1938619 RepID=A0A5C5X7E3_9PLAN|nr:AAA family ATPase [Thalassoglobus neptunius]TWT58860.1 Chromosome partitioning protein ParA [Thalassoglobus neptunius]